MVHPAVHERLPAREQVELHAARSCARLLADRGDRGTAIELLAPIYNWFTEGFDANDLNEAKALLEELGEELG